MIIPDKIIEVIKAKSFSEIGLNNLVSDKDFLLFSENIAEKTGYDSIGINTWKRIFGHLRKPNGEQYNTSMKTAKIIAEYLGCDDWEELCENSDFLYNRYISNGGLCHDSVIVLPQNDRSAMLIAALKKGDIIEVKSRPNKMLRLEFITSTADSKWFKIIETVGSSNLQNLDEVEIPFLRMNHPIVASQLIRKGSLIGGYSAGSKQVVYSIEKIKK